jgi:hypothetical protein
MASLSPAPDSDSSTTDRVVGQRTSDDGSEGHIRGVDVIRFRDELASEKLSYVKG